MKKNRHTQYSPSKLPAFTILEVTITMLVAAIVIGIAYTSFNVVSKSYLAFKSRNEDMAVLTRVDQLLKRDFDQATIITDSLDGIVIHKKDQNSVLYEITTNALIRKAAIIDTFKVSIKAESASTSFEGKLKISGMDNAGELNTENQADATIDELSFIALYDNESIPYHYKKQYSSVNLIERNTHAVN